MKWKQVVRKRRKGERSRQRDRISSLQVDRRRSFMWNGVQRSDDQLRHPTGPSEQNNLAPFTTYILLEGIAGRLSRSHELDLAPHGFIVVRRLTSPQGRS